MKALVTGATGFVGSTLCEELNKRGVEVRAIQVPSGVQAGDRVEVSIRPEDCIVFLEA